jgi:hypothetical protein
MFGKLLPAITAESDKVIVRRLKSAVQGLPYPLFLRLYYANYFLRDIPRAERNRRRSGFGRLDELDLRKWKSSDTLFILGSGPSINEISADRWAAISRHDTIGFNFWLYHRFVPKIYFAESHILDADLRGLVAYQSIAARRALDYADTLKIIFNMHLNGKHEADEWPAEWKRGFHAAPDLPLPARDEDEIMYGLRYLHSKHVFGNRWKLRCLFRYCSTVTGLIAFGQILGYSKIVLCGIDLKVQEYFYQNPSLYPENVNLEISPREPKHATMVAVPWRVPADVAILLMKRELLQPAGVELYVENRSSALWPRLDEAPQDVFEGAPTRSLASLANCGQPA